MTPKNKYDVAIFSKNDMLIKDVKSELLKTKQFLLLENTISDYEDYKQQIQTKQPDVIFLDYSLELEDTPKWVEQLVRNYPMIPIAVIFSEADISNSNDVVLAGARAFFQYPFAHEAFLKMMNRISELINRLFEIQPVQQTGEEGIDVHSTFILFSPKGGVGTTTTAINLAIAFKQQQKSQERNVLLIDGKHRFGHASLYLNLRTANSVIDLISHVGKIDKGLIRQITISHSSGIDVLTSPTSFAEAQGIRVDSLYKSITDIQNVYDTLFIDAGNFLDDTAVTYMDSAFRILLVLTPDLASLRDAKKFIDITRGLSYPREKIVVILNKTGKKSEMRIAEMENILKVRILGTIPSNEELMTKCINDGNPLMVQKPRHAICRSYKSIAKDLQKILDNEAGHNAASTDNLLKMSSQLG